MRKFLTSLASIAMLTAPMAPSFADIEKPAAIDGSAYSIIPNVLNTIVTTNGQTDSYIRLFNGGLSAASFDFQIVQPLTGANVGSAFSISVPSRASLQFRIGELFGAQYANTTVAAGTGFMVYLKSSEPKAGYQHVYYNDGTKFFENASVCTNLLNQVMLAASNTFVLTNLTSSVLASGAVNYPTTVVIHNYSTSAATYRIVGVNARTGESIGTTDKTVQGNQTFNAPFYNGTNANTLAASLQTQFGWTPGASDLWVNLFITDVTGGVPQAVATHAIGNNTLGGQFAMTTACALNAPVAAAVSATTASSFDGVVTLSNGTTGTFSLTIPASGSSASAVETPSAVEKAAAVERQLALLTISGSYRTPAGATITLTGTYNTVTRAINLSGGTAPNIYTFIGAVSGTGTVTGTLTGPSLTGSFGGGKQTPGTTSKAYCGTYSGHDDEGSTSGSFSLVVNGTTVNGSHRSPDGDSGPIYGTLSGTSFTGHAPSDEGTVSLSGTVTATTFSGTYSGGPVGGQFSGTSCGSF